MVESRETSGADLSALRIDERARDNGGAARGRRRLIGAAIVACSS